MARSLVPDDLWAALHRVLLERLHGAGEINWRRAALDSAGVPAKGGARSSARIRRTAASRTRSGTWPRTPAAPPLGVALSGANRHDSRMLAPALDAIPPVRSGRRGRPRRRPDKLHAAKAHDRRRCRRECHARGVTPRIARQEAERSDRLGRHRWVVERTLGWLSRFRFRRLAVRDERRAAIHLASTTLACACVCLKQVRRFSPGRSQASAGCGPS